MGSRVIDVFLIATLVATACSGEHKSALKWLDRPSWRTDPKTAFKQLARDSLGDEVELDVARVVVSPGKDKLTAFDVHVRKPVALTITKLTVTSLGKHRSKLVLRFGKNLLPVVIDSSRAELRIDVPQTTLPLAALDFSVAGVRLHGEVTVSAQLALLAHLWAASTGKLRLQCNACRTRGGTISMPHSTLGKGLSLPSVKLGTARAAIDISRGKATLTLNTSGELAASARGTANLADPLRDSTAHMCVKLGLSGGSTPMLGLLGLNKNLRVRFGPTGLRVAADPQCR